MIDWRWRMLFNLIRVAYASDQEALWRTTCILRAKMHVDKKYT